jgi:hypothetical protein
MSPQALSKVLVLSPFTHFTHEDPDEPQPTRDDRHEDITDKTKAPIT